MSESDKRDQELQQRLRQTLDEAAARPDPLLDAALSATRAQIAARAHRPRHSPWWLAGGFAVAASLAVVLVLPLGGGLPTGPVSAPVVAAGPAMPDADLQLLQDMDMLAALGSET